MKKVIHVLMHSTYNRDIVSENIRNGWHVRLGSAIAEHTEYSVECWSVDFDVDRERSYVHEGLPLRVFPSSLLPGTRNSAARRIIGSAKHGEDFSWRLLLALREELRNGSIVHFHGDVYLNTYVGSLLPGMKFLHHHGGLSGAPTIERHSFSSLDHIFVLTDQKREYYAETVGLPPSRLSVQPMGVDFDMYRERNTSTEDLGIKADHLLMYTGAFDKYKGLDVVLDAFEEVRREKDVELVAFGGSDDDSLYSRIRSTDGVTGFTNYVPDSRYIDYLSAANAYVSYPVEKSLRGGDCGLIAPAEAMACNTPVVSPVMRAYPESLQEKLPNAPNNQAEFQRMIRNVLNGSSQDIQWRTISEHQFSWQYIAKSIARRYDMAEGE